MENISKIIHLEDGFGYKSNPEFWLFTRIQGSPYFGDLDFNWEFVMTKWIH